jgi:hypothetical protein
MDDRQTRLALSCALLAALAGLAVQATPRHSSGVEMSFPSITPQL